MQCVRLNLTRKTEASSAMSTFTGRSTNGTEQTGSGRTFGSRRTGCALVRLKVGNRSRVQLWRPCCYTILCASAPFLHAQPDAGGGDSWKASWLSRQLAVFPQSSNHQCLDIKRLQATTLAVDLAEVAKQQLVFLKPISPYAPRTSNSLQSLIPKPLNTCLRPTTPKPKQYPPKILNLRLQALQHPEPSVT